MILRSERRNVESDSVYPPFQFLCMPFITVTIKNMMLLVRKQIKYMKE